jgi:hypothetical protein
MVLIVMGNAGTIGEAAILAEDDALMIFFAAIGGVLFTLLLALLFWTGSRRRKALERSEAPVSLVPTEESPDRW